MDQLKRPISWRETRRRMAEDRKAFIRMHTDYFDIKPRFPSAYPGYQAIVLHRVSHYMYARGNRWIARALWHLGLFISGADLPPIADIGPGLAMAHPQGCVVVGKAGKNLFMCGQCGIGGGLGDAVDIGAGPGLPIVGDDVIIGFGSLVLGPIRVGDRARIGPRCLVTKDVPANAETESSSPFQFRQSAPEKKTVKQSAAGRSANDRAAEGE